MEALDKYPKTGHAVIMGKIKQEWQDREYVLGLFGQKESSCKKGLSVLYKKGYSPRRQTGPYRGRAHPFIRRMGAHQSK